MKTYICPNYLKDSLLANLLKDEPSIFGIEIISINQFLQDIYPDAALNTYAIYQHLTALPLTDLKGSLKDGAFLKGCLKDRYLCDMYGIKPNDLALHPDYQLILNALPSLNRELLVEKLKDDFSNYTIV